jgi:hypothetical protein
VSAKPGFSAELKLDVRSWQKALELVDELVEDFKDPDGQNEKGRVGRFQDLVK